MTVLRKSCRKCTSAKRKCNVQLPSCARCSQRGLDCVYDLEPLDSGPVVSLKGPRFSFNPSNCDSPGYCVLKPLTFRDPSIHPEICQPKHEDAYEVVRTGFLSVPDLFKAGRPALFAHPKLQTGTKCNSIATFANDASQPNILRPIIQRIVECDVHALSISDALIAQQSLLVYLAAYMFFSPPDPPLDAGPFVDVLDGWTREMLSSAGPRMPDTYSPWQRWLLAESIRRTLIMSASLSMTWHSYQHGFCANWLLVESLPIDRRVGLWMAESPQAWIAAAGVRTGDEVGEELSSFHEFAVAAREVKTGFGGDLFMGLLAAVHNG